MRKEKKVYLFVSLTVAATGLILSNTYRPFIYENNINDFGFADTIGSLVSAIGSFFFVAGIKEYTPVEKNQIIIGLTLLQSIVWESLGLIDFALTPKF